MSSRATLFRELAANSARNAGEAETEEFRRAWLVVEREWLAMATRDDARDRFTYDT